MFTYGYFVSSKRFSVKGLSLQRSHEAHKRKERTPGSDRNETSENASEPWKVNLAAPTGTVDYQLPISIDETYSSREVSKYLSPSGSGNRDTAQDCCRSNKLLGLPIDDHNYRFPKFQIDEAGHKIRPVVAYANQLLECNEDPWGTLDWWYSEDEALDGQRPIELLVTSELTEELVGFAVKLGRQAMD